MARNDPSPQPLPIQAPVESPILCNPYEEPSNHWAFDDNAGEARKEKGRRPAGYYFKLERAGSERQMRLKLTNETDERRERLDLVNQLRDDIRRWRQSGYEGATPITKELLRHWWREDRWRRLFFCQLEAAETIIYLNEIRLPGRRTRFKSAVSEADLLKNLRDIPADPDLLPLLRQGVKMATGSGKTVVMAMLIAWAFCNRGQVSSDERFPNAALIVCPNLTVKERLQVLRPEHPHNYHTAFDIVPGKLRPLLSGGKLLITNWHLFQPESPHTEAGQSFAVVNKGPEGVEAFGRRVLGDLYARARAGGLLVMNDEAHHAWRPKPDLPHSREAAISKEELEEATIWVNGLDTLNSAVSIRTCIDLSATPFYIQGSGHIEGSPFPWLVSDFGLVDAIESGIVKIPRLPVSDTTGRPEPKYFRLWQHITDGLQPGERLPGRAGKPKPEVVYREAEDALKTLAGQWLERFKIAEQANDTQDKTPPVLIIVCDNTDIAGVFYRKISGEQEEEYVEQSGNKKTKRTRTVFGRGQIFPDHFSNTENYKPTIRIDSKLLAQAESGDPNVSKQEAAEYLRQIVATVGKRGEPGEQVRCVVSVAMLTEGWDANNVTQILGLRAFGSQLLCEQVVGRGLRRIDYTVDPQTGKLTEEYVDIYGIPFSLIPFKGRKHKQAAPEDKPKNHVKALPERKAYEMRFPVVEGYAIALKRNLIMADIAAMEPLRLEPEYVPTAVFVKPRVGYQIGAPSMSGPGEFLEQNRQAFYDSTHLQTIEFEIARQIVTALTGDQHHTPAANLKPALRYQSRHQLFPQVLRLVKAFTRSRVDFRGVPDPRELGHERYIRRIVERMVDAIRPDDAQGELPLMPILNRYAPIGTSADIDFKTTHTVHSTIHSHINAMPLDTATWESSAAFYIEQAAFQGAAKFYVRNEGLGFSIPYEFMGVSHVYEPDFLVRLANDVTLLLEIKGLETEKDKAKHDAARRWRDAVNNWGNLGQWTFHVCRDPHLLPIELRHIAKAPPSP